MSCVESNTDSDKSGENTGCHVGLDPVEVRRTTGSAGTNPLPLPNHRPSVCLCLCA